MRIRAKSDWLRLSSRSFRIAVVVEAAVLTLGAGLYVALNRSLDFRRYANDTKDLKWTLEIYYRIGELMNKEYNGRALDKEAWGIVDPPKEN